MPSVGQVYQFPDRAAPATPNLNERVEAALWVHDLIVAGVRDGRIAGDTAEAERELKSPQLQTDDSR
jgi:hypothetical protein